MKKLLFFLSLFTLLGADFAFGQSQNYLINGGFDLWQRGAANSFVNSDGYLADRWFVIYTGTSANQDRNASNLPTGQKYGNQITVTSASWWMCQRIESGNTLPFSGQKMTISGYERSSSGTSGLKLKIDYANSVDTWGTFPARGKNATSFTNALAATTLLTSTSTTLTPWRYTFTVSSNMATNGFQICLGNDSTVTTTYQLSAIMLNEGMKKQKFARFGKSFDGEITAAQRFFEKSFPLDQPPTDCSYSVVHSTCSKYYTGQYTNCGFFFKVAKFKACGSPYRRIYDCAGTINAVSDENPGNPAVHGIGEAGDNCDMIGSAAYVNSNHDTMSAIFNFTADAEL